MKKNISINISGIIFHIEEDGYENLRKYLDSINKYFSTFEDSSEIMADIESRIAEIFLSKLNEGKQVITSEDVISLIATMGSVSDFKAAEDQDFSQQAPPPPQAEPTSSSTGQGEYTYTPPKTLMRDQQRKILGGVCAGLANYLNVDTVWVRLLFAVLAFAWGFTIFVYLLMWIIVPGSYEIKETEIPKKMFRDPERKVLGGVSGGLASYLGIDILAVRVLFVIFTIAGGLGIFIYIILWVILPEAKSLTDRMKMQGEPVTLSNIESNIKKNQLNPDPKENTLNKILLFPFRLLGIILQALARVLVPLVEVIRVAIGILVVFIGISLILSAIVGGGVLLGVFSSTAFSFTPGWDMEYNELSLPVHAFTNAFPTWVAVTGFLAAIIPCVFLILLGVSIVARRIVFNATLGWTLFVTFFVCVACLSVGIPKIIFAFKETGEYRNEISYHPTGKTVLFKINEIGLDDYDGTTLTLKGHAEKEFKLVQDFIANGTTRAQAIENTKMVDYNVNVQDSVFTFDSNVTFKPDAKFRNQRLNMTLYIPYNYPFVMNEDMSRFISQYIDHEDLDGFIWKMTENGLECINCPKDEKSEDEFDLTDFDELDLRGIFDVHIYRGDDYKVELNGPETEKKKYKIYKSGHTLVVEFEGQKTFNWDMKFDKVMSDKIRVNITMPDLEKLEATGYGNIDFDEFNTNDLEIDIRGPINVAGELQADDLVIHLNGKSEANLRGRAHNMTAEIQFASKLKAYDLEVTNATVEASGASNAKVNVTGSLDLEEGVASKIDYRRTPETLNKH